jgi:hypothetical protein
MMKCSGCASVNVCRFVGEMKSTEDQVKNIVTNELPFSIAISCKFFNEDKRPKNFNQFMQQTQSYKREDILGV